MTKFLSLVIAAFLFIGFMPTGFACDQAGRKHCSCSQKCNCSKEGACTCAKAVQPKSTT